MTYKVTRIVDFNGGYDQPSFTAFIDQYTYEEYGSLFPEITQHEYVDTVLKVKQIANDPFGDIASYPGYVSSSNTIDLEESRISVEFTDKATFDDYINGAFMEVNIEGFGVSLTPIETRYYGDDVINGRTVVTSADPQLPPGAILKLGIWLGRSWQIYRKAIVSYIVEDAA